MRKPEDYIFLSVVSQQFLWILKKVQQNIQKCDSKDLEMFLSLQETSVTCLQETFSHIFWINSLQSSQSNLFIIILNNS